MKPSSNDMNTFPLERDVTLASVTLSFTGKYTGVVFCVCIQDINMNDETSADQTDLSTSPPLPPYVPPPPPPPPPLALANFTVHEPQERLNLSHAAKEELTQRENCSKENKQKEKCVPTDGCDVVRGEFKVHLSFKTHPAGAHHCQRGRSTLPAFPWSLFAA